MTNMFLMMAAMLAVLPGGLFLANAFWLAEPHGRHCKPAAPVRASLIATAAAVVLLRYPREGA